MKNKKAGERKRTVTITMGPKTEKILEALKAKLLEGTPGLPWTDTQVVTVCFWRGLQAQIEAYKVKLDGEFPHSFE